MSPRRHPERELQTAVVQFAELLGWLVAHFEDSRRQIIERSGERRFVGDKAAAGFPDLVLTRDRVVFVELKSEIGRLSKRQQQWIDSLDAAGAEIHVWRPANWPDDVTRVLTTRTTAKESA